MNPAAGDTASHVNGNRQGGPARLLIVDDEAPVLSALRRALHQRFGPRLEIVTEQDPTAALARLHAERFDVVISDLRMPAIDGLTLLTLGSALQPHGVGMLLTASGDFDTARRAINEAGLFRYLNKPWHDDELAAHVEAALAEAQRLAHVAELEFDNRELEAFTRSASHDLRSPLNAVLGLAMLLRRHAAPDLSEQHLQWLGGIEQSARHMNRLIDGLMRLSYLGRHALELQPVALAPLVRGLLDDVRRQYPGHPARVVCAELPTVRADALLLGQVFVNLLTNAFKFTARCASPLIEIGCRLCDGERVFCVRDNGPGFDMAQAGKLFEAFQRLHPSGEFEGTGVGLSIVQRIVQRHGGRVWVEAEPGHGARFNFTLGEAGLEGRA